MVKMKIKVRKGYTKEAECHAYKRIVHEHLRYAHVINISQFPPKGEFIEFTIEIPNRKWAEMVAGRIRSFGDYAEILEE